MQRIAQQWERQVAKYRQVSLDARNDSRVRQVLGSVFLLKTVRGL